MNGFGIIHRMNQLGIVIFFSLIGSVFSLIGGFILLSSKKSAVKLATYATPFAAGALLAAAFVDLLGEASEKGEASEALVWTMIGILIFFLLERFLRWFHHHHEHEDHKADPNTSLIVIGDTLHNFIDGVAIAAGFLTSIEVGIIVTIAVAAHEIPQEIGDFGLLLSKGFSRKKVIIVNLVSALVTVLAAGIFYTIGQKATLPDAIITGLVAGFFIYIAVSDIIPSIHKHEERKLAGLQTLMLLLGVVVVSLLTVSLHQLMP